MIVWRLCGCSLAGRCGRRGGLLANALFYFQRDWLWTSGGLLVISGCVVSWAL